MTDKPLDQTAFPSLDMMEPNEKGLSARQYFAAHAPITLADAVADYSETANPTKADVLRRLAQMRWHYADEMIAAET